jgi:hypothetical protein
MRAGAFFLLFSGVFGVIRFRAERHDVLDVRVNVGSEGSLTPEQKWEKLLKSFDKGVNPLDEDPTSQITQAYWCGIFVNSIGRKNPENLIAYLFAGTASTISFGSSFAETNPLVKSVLLPVAASFIDYKHPSK